VNNYSNTTNFDSKNRQYYVDTDIHLCEDPLFNALVVADFLNFQENVELDLTDPYETYNKILSLVGHFSNGHILNAAEYLFKHRKYLKDYYGVGLPKRTNTIDDLIGEVKSPFANVTSYDIARALSDYNLIEASPKEVFDFAQEMINEYRLWLLDSLNGRERTRLVDSNGNSLFGLKATIDIEFKDEKDYEDFWIGTAWALAVMDNFSYRASTGLDIGGGICLPINLENMINAPMELKHDLKTLSCIDVYEILKLEKDLPLPIAEELFYEKILPGFIKQGIAIEGKATQGKDITAGYIRIKKGPGTADFMAIGFGWLAKGRHGSAGILLGDAEDTAQVLARDVYFNGQDEALFNELMSIKKFRDIVEEYLQPEWTNALINWSYEDPKVGFSIASCSQSYQSRLAGPTSDTFTTLRKEQWFFENFHEQFHTGTVSRHMPRWRVGFERAPSRQYFDYVIKKAHEFTNNKIFPGGSWIYDNLGKVK